MAPPQASQILGQMEDTSIQASHLWSPGGCNIWQGPWNNLNSGRIFPRRLFQSDSNDGPSSRHSNLGQMKDTPVQVSHLWWVQYLAKDPRPDINNGLGDNWNSGRILVPSVYSTPFQIIAPSQAIPILECRRRLPQLALSPPF